jgi:hypothetical protein
VAVLTANGELAASAGTLVVVAATAGVAVVPLARPAEIRRTRGATVSLGGDQGRDELGPPAFQLLPGFLAILVEGVDERGTDHDQATRATVVARRDHGEIDPCLAHTDPLAGRRTIVEVNLPPSRVPGHDA